MDASWTQDLLGWLNAHPAWGVILVFLIAMLESLVLVGILLPGIVILFGVGALIGLGVLDLIPIWIAASAGAFLGDSASYALGYRYREHLVDIWPFSRYPGMLRRGQLFFEAHGQKSVLAGRFIGPLRPIIPAVVGMIGMKPARFLAVDTFACIAWAPSFLLPGMLFGASLEVASEYTGRLTVMLVMGVLILWLIWWAMRLIYEPLASRSARWLRRAIRWARRHPILGRIIGPLLDPSRPEVLSVSMLGILLVLIFWGLVMLLFLSPFSSQPQAIDQAVREVALSLRNHLADPIMVAISQLSRWPVPLLSAVALSLWLFGARRQNAAVHWMIAIGGGWLIQFLLSLGLRATPRVIDMADIPVKTPSTAMSLATVVLAFFAIMVARELRRRHRQWPYLAAALILTMLLLARIYLGLEWLSGALMGVTMGLAWVAIIGIAYRQRAVRPFSGTVASLIFYGSLLILFGWQVQAHTQSDLLALQTTMPKHEMTRENWWAGEWSSLSTDRTRLLSVASRRFNAQIAVDPDRMAGLLEQTGWTRVPETDWRWVLQALNPEPDQATLPLLGRAFQGRSEELLLRKDHIQKDHLLTLRMWDSGARLMPGNQEIYLVQFSEEKLVQRYKLFSYWRSLPLDASRLAPIREVLDDFDQKLVNGDLLLVRDRGVRE